MPALFDNTVLDAALDVIKEATVLHICSSDPAEPTTRQQVIDQSLATVTLTGGDYLANFNGDPDGRATTVDPKSDVPVDGTGTPTHYCLIDDVDRLIAKTEVNPASPDLTEGSTTDIPEVTFSVADPQVV